MGQDQQKTSLTRCTHVHSSPNNWQHGRRAAHLSCCPGISQVSLGLARLCLPGIQSLVCLLPMSNASELLSSLHIGYAHSCHLPGTRQLRAVHQQREECQQHEERPAKSCTPTTSTAVRLSHLEAFQPVLLAPQRALACRQLLRLRLCRRLPPLQLLLCLLHLRGGWAPSKLVRVGGHMPARQWCDGPCL